MFFMLRRRKLLLLTFMYLLLCAYIMMLFPYQAFADSVEHILIPQSGNAVANYNQYPLINYQLDTYINNSIFNYLWSIRDGLDADFSVVIAYAVNVLFLVNVFLSMVVGSVIQEIYDLNIANSILTTGISKMRSLAGISSNGNFLSQGIYPQLLSFLILLLAVWLIWTIIIKRKTTSGFSAFLMAFGLFVFSIVFIAKADVFMKWMNEFGKEIETSFFNLIGDNNGVETVRTRLFDLTTVQPFKILQFGDLNVDNATVSKILSLNPSDAERQQIIKKLVEDGNIMMGSEGVMLRLIFYPFIMVVNSVLQVITLILCSIKYFYSVYLYVLVLLCPLFLVVAIVPFLRKTAQNWLMKLLGTFLKKTGISMVITIMFMANSIVYSLADARKYGFLVTMVVQIVVCIGVFIKRKDIFSIFGLSALETGRQGKDFVNQSLRQIRRAESINYLLTRGGMRRNSLAFAGAGGADGGIDRKNKPEPKLDEKNMSAVDRMKKDEKELKELDELNRASKRIVESENLKGQLDKNGNLVTPAKNTFTREDAMKRNAEFERKRAQGATFETVENQQKKVEPSKNNREDIMKRNAEWERKRTQGATYATVEGKNKQDLGKVTKTENNKSNSTSQSKASYPMVNRENVNSPKNEKQAISGIANSWDWVNQEWIRDTNGDLPKEAFKTMPEDEKNREIEAQNIRRQTREREKVNKQIPAVNTYFDDLVKKNNGQSFKMSPVDEVFLNKLPNAKEFKRGQTFDVDKWRKRNDVNKSR